MDDMQSRIAARRAEVERERRRADVAAQIAEDNQRAEEKAAADREWAKEEGRRRERKEQAAQAASVAAEAASIKAEKEKVIRLAVRGKWTGVEIGMVLAPLAFGLYLLFSHPIWGGIVLLVAGMLYAGGNSTHRDEVRKERPDLFD